MPEVDQNTMAAKVATEEATAKSKVARYLRYALLVLLLLPLAILAYLWVDSFVRTHTGPFRDIPTDLTSGSDITAAMVATEDIIRQSMGDALLAADRLTEIGYRCEATDGKYIKFLLETGKVQTDPNLASGMTCRYKLDLTGSVIYAYIIGDSQGKVVFIRTGKNFPLAL
ncbi:MAG TPA: hypothetical protein VN112_14405 [Ensifer sp.]|nr:hypothetical protein [Ensifer sp.]